MNDEDDDDDDDDICVCVCVRTCVRACVRGCVSTRACVQLTCQGISFPGMGDTVFQRSTSYLNPSNPPW